MAIPSNCGNCKYMCQVKTLVREYSVYVCDAQKHKIAKAGAVFTAFGYDKPPNTGPIKVYTKHIDDAKVDTKSQLWQKASIAYGGSSAPRIASPKNDGYDSPDRCCCGALATYGPSKSHDPYHQSYCNYQRM